jgi:phospholipase D
MVGCAWLGLPAPVSGRACAEGAAPDAVPAMLSVCFTLPERCGLRVADAILAARRSVRVQAYGFDYQPIVAALLAAGRRGVDVQVILDRSNERRRDSALPDLEQASIPVYIDDRPAIAHNKIIIVDGCLVIGGSFNYTYSAEYRNAENVTFITSCPAGAWFAANWEQRRAVSRPVPGSVSSAAVANQPSAQPQMQDGWIGDADKLHRGAIGQ